MKMTKATTILNIAQYIKVSHGFEVESVICVCNCKVVVPYSLTLPVVKSGPFFSILGAKSGSLIS